MAKRRLFAWYQGESEEHPDALSEFLRKAHGEPSVRKSAHVPETGQFDQENDEESQEPVGGLKYNFQSFS